MKHITLGIPVLDNVCGKVNRVIKKNWDDEVTIINEKELFYGNWYVSIWLSAKL